MSCNVAALYLIKTTGDACLQCTKSYEHMKMRDKMDESANTRRVNNIITKHKILISRFIVRQVWEEDKGIKNKYIEIGKSEGD